MKPFRGDSISEAEGSAVLTFSASLLDETWKTSPVEVEENIYCKK